MVDNICKYCKQEVGASSDRKSILLALQSIKKNAEDAEKALIKREERKENSSSELFDAIKRIEDTLGVNLSSEEMLVAVHELEQRIRARIAVEDRRSLELSKKKKN